MWTETEANEADRNQDLKVRPPAYPRGQPRQTHSPSTPRDDAANEAYDPLTPTTTAAKARTHQ